MMHPIDRDRAVALVQGLVAISSVSRQESEAAGWLVEQMTGLGYSRAYVDAAGNAIGEMGPEDAEQVIVLLGHIDTVPGAIPVRVEDSASGPVLYGRGSVDAKGPLATFVAAAARAGAAWADQHGVRLVVVGAVEEEAATSKGARFIRSRFDGVREPVPVACIIGEPSGWQRVTLGYKGRLLVEMTARQPMAHTAGPDAGVATVAVDLWNWAAAYAERFNAERGRTFDQLSLSLRRLHTDVTDQMDERVEAQIGIRLPLAADALAVARAVVAWAAERAGAEPPGLDSLPDAEDRRVTVAGPHLTIDLCFRGHEPAWRSERDPLLVRSFLAAIRAIAPQEKPSFVVKTGTSDMNVVAPVWRCPIVAYGPGDSSLDHTPQEHLNLTEYWQAVLVLEQTLRNLGALLRPD
jgi:LysW-gamma-L-lysine carboxypeptidase